MNLDCLKEKTSPVANVPRKKSIYFGKFSLTSYRICDDAQRVEALCSWTVRESDDQKEISCDIEHPFKDMDVLWKDDIPPKN